MIFIEKYRHTDAIIESKIILDELSKFWYAEPVCIAKLFKLQQNHKIMIR